MSAMTHIKKYTIKDIDALPDGQRAELIDGQIYNMSAPNTKHQRLVMYLSNSIFNYIETNNGDCEVFPAPFAVFLDADDKTYVEPDISVICDPEKLTDKGCNGAPDWIIEIVSQSSRYMDYRKSGLCKNKSGQKESRIYGLFQGSSPLFSVYSLLNAKKKINNI